MARWLASQPGINFFVKQRQGHTALHKAAWGGHLALVRYFREEIGMWDEKKDDDNHHRRCNNKNGSNKCDNEDDNDCNNDDSSFFKARLVAVLLEYGDKGIDLSNVKKKWKQVWPKIPFPSQHQMIHEDKNDSDEDDDDSVEEEKQQQQQNSMNNNSKKIIPLSHFLLQNAGDVIRLERIGEKNRRVIVHVAKHQYSSNSKENILREAKS